MERAFVGAALGFALAILLAVASVEMVGINQTFATSLMDAAMVIAVGVAGLLAVAWWLDSRAAARRRAARDSALTAALAASESREEARTAPSRPAPEIVPWVATPSEVVVAAPTATAWADADAELTGAPRRSRRAYSRDPHRRFAGLFRHVHPLAPDEWQEVVEADEREAARLDARAHDDLPPTDDSGDWAEPLVGRSRPHPVHRHPDY